MFIDELNYILARIKRYQRNNQYIYLRAFKSWSDAYNQVATRLNAQGTTRVPLFRLKPDDFSKSGKTITDAGLARFVKTISKQVARLEERRAESARFTAGETDSRHPFRHYYLRDQSGNLLTPISDEKRVVVALPPGAAGQERFRLGIQPALDNSGLSAFLVDHAVTDDCALGEICRQLHACRLLIADLSGQAANVMLVLGLAYGSGKPVIILQQQEAPSLGATGNAGCLRFTDTEALRSGLAALLTATAQF